MPTLPQLQLKSRDEAESKDQESGRPRLGGDLSAAPAEDVAGEVGEELEESGAQEQQPQHQWTTGSGLATKGVTAGIVICLASGAISLGWHVFGPDPAPQQVAAESGEDPDRASRRDVAGDTAARWVRAWLTTPAADRRDLESIYPDQVVLPEKASKASEVRVTDAVATGPDLWSITVSAQVTPPGGQETTRMFSVPVQVGGKAGNVAATPVTPPAPVAAPKQADVVAADGYGHTATDAGSLGETVNDFMSALLTSDGDLSRVISPDATLRPVGGYERVEVESIRLAEDVAGSRDSEVPKDGATAKALVTVQMFEEGAPKNAREGLQAIYPIELTARGDRWEVSSLDASLTSVEENRSSKSSTTTKE